MSKEKVESPLDDVDAFMNPKQLEYFKTKLINWRDQILRECSDTITDLQDNQSEADIN